jgi:outer membrane immunogenic protein
MQAQLEGGLNMHTRSMLVLTLLMVATALPAKAQEEVAKLEEYGGYSYIRFNVSQKVNGVTSHDSYNASGGGGQLEYNPKPWLGIVGDLSGYVVTQGSPVAGTFSYLFGPRVNFRHHGKVTPYAQTLFGGIAATSDILSSGPANHFAMTVGGGVDYSVSKVVAIRLVQAEYYMTKFPDGLNNRQDNFRFATGLVFRLGRK